MHYINTKNLLKVPANSWRWPPIWPFPGEILEKSERPMRDVELIDEKLIKSFARHYSAFTNSSNSLLRVGTSAVIEKTGDNIHKSAYI